MPEHTAIGLLNRAGSGTWKTGNLGGSHTMSTVHEIPFQGPADDDRGFVRRDVVTLETGDDRHALRTHPKWAPDGTIKGWIPVPDAPANAVFEADVGFKAGAQATDGVDFRVFAHYDSGGSISLDQVANTTKGYDGSLDTVRADLSSYGTSLRKIELRVDAGGASSTQDWAVWVDPVIFDGSTHSNTVAGFQPTTAGFHHPNSYDVAAIPDQPIDIPDPFGPGTVDTVEIPDDYGLCGGMTFAAKDYYEAGVSPWDDDLLDDRPSNSPTNTDPPAEGSPLFQYYWNRLLDSFEHGTVARFAKLMHPAFRDKESSLWGGDANRADVMRQEFETIANRIDDDNLVPLGVVEHKTWNMGQIFFNHQVLAYGYERTSDRATIHIYDPNCPLNDEVRITFPWRDPTNQIRGQYRRHYVEQVDGTLEGRSVSAGSRDSVSGTSVSGDVWEGNDGFRFDGAIRNSSLEDPSSVDVFIDGEPAPWFGDGQRTVVIEGHSSDEPIEYDFTVAGWLSQEDGTLEGHSVSDNAADQTTNIWSSGDRGASASGTVWAGADGFSFDGEIVSASVSDPEQVTVYVDGEEVDQFRGVGQSSGDRTIVFEGSAPHGSDYSFEVTGADHPDDTIYAVFAIDHWQEDPPTNW